MYSQYGAAYLQAALNQLDIAAPSPTAAGALNEVLFSLYQAHRLGGTAAVAATWSKLKSERPELVDLERRKLIHADELKYLTKPMYLIDKYAIYAGAFNLLSGPSGCGKSFTALDIAGNIGVANTVVYIAGEGLNGYAARWEAWRDFNLVETAELHFYVEALQVMKEDKLSEFISIISEHRPALVVIDTLARSMVGFDENSAKDMGEFVQSCDRIRTSLGCAVLVVHHTGKNGLMRGSSALYGAADAVMTQFKNDGVIAIHNDDEKGGKNKYSAPLPSIYYRIKPHPVGEFDGAVLVPADQMVMHTSDSLNDRQITILQVLSDSEDVTQLGMAATELMETTEIPRSSFFRVMKELKHAGYIEYRDEMYYITKKGKEAL